MIKDQVTHKIGLARVLVVRGVEIQSEAPGPKHGYGFLWKYR